jgi:hypothetical protein
MFVATELPCNTRLEKVCAPVKPIVPSIVVRPCGRTWSHDRVGIRTPNTLLEFQKRQSGVPGPPDSDSESRDIVSAVKNSMMPPGPEVYGAEHLLSTAPHAGFGRLP